MSQYYCSYILNNLSKIIEDDKTYKIEIPLSKDDNEQHYENSVVFMSKKDIRQHSKLLSKN